MMEERSGAPGAQAGSASKDGKISGPVDRKRSGHGIRRFLRSAPSLDGLWPLGILLLRIYFGAAIFIAHGWPKLLEMLAGGGPFLNLVKSLGFPLPGLFAWLAVLGQVVGSLLVMLGLWTRPAALTVASTIFFGAAAVHGPEGFRGLELGFAYTVVLVAIAITGPGRFSVDRQINKGS
ncbi:MAG: DoxX family protein [Acidobacteriota bacterium]